MLKRKTDPATPAPASPAPDTVQQARTRARQRLIGAAVLLVIGIIGFPLVFESQPRPIPVDIPIEIPKKDGAAPLVMPAERPTVAPSTSRVEPTPIPGSDTARSPHDASPTDAAPSVAAGDGIITESRSDGGREISAPTAPSHTAASTASVSPAVPASAPSARAALKPPVKTASNEPARKASAPLSTSAGATPSSPDSAEAARARALLEGKPTASASTTATPTTTATTTAAADAARFVVQVGAFADANAARETRQKVEKLGMKTYTQVAETASGSRIRVRVGPFTSREEADRALAKAKAAGLSAVLLTL